MHFFRFLTPAVLLSVFLATPALADFSITSAIIEFNTEKPVQQDIEVVSRSKETQYIVAELYEVQNPGSPQERRVKITEPEQGELLVTPDKLVLAGGGRKVVRFVLLGQPGATEKVYRAVIKPAIKGLDNESQIGLKVLVGYEVLVIVRPAAMKPAYNASRQGRTMTVSNTGNTDILFQNGVQCPAGINPPSAKCVQAPVIRVYPGQSSTTELPFDTAISYSVWDGKSTVEHQY